MNYYRPKILAFLSVIISTVNSAGFPVFGFIFAKLLFVIMIGD